MKDLNMGDDLKGFDEEMNKILNNKIYIQNNQ